MIESIAAHNDFVTFTDRDRNDFTATVCLTREDLAKLVVAMEGGKQRSRFSTFMEPDTTDLTAAGAYLKTKIGYSLAVILDLQGWTRIWTAESHGWKRNA